MMKSICKIFTTNLFSNFSIENTFLTCDENDLECFPQNKQKIQLDAFDKIQPLRNKRLHLISRKTKIVPGITFQKLAFHFIKQVQKMSSSKNIVLLIFLPFNSKIKKSFANKIAF